MSKRRDVEEKKSLQETKEIGPVVRVELIGDEEIYHDVPIISPLFSVLLGRHINVEVGETYEDRCHATHEYLIEMKTEGIEEDFFDFLKQCSMIAIYVGDDPLDKALLEETEEMQENLLDVSSTEANSGTT